jgi:putative transposon-encoded protein
MVIYVVRKHNVAEKPMEIKMAGYEVVEKRAKQCSTSARVLVPKAWIGKRVRAVRVDP